MSESLSLSSLGGGSGGDSGVFCLFFCVELLLIELSFSSVVLVVISSLTSSRSGSTSLVDVQLQLFFCSSKFSVSSKAIFGRAVLLRVSDKVSG